MTCLSVTTRTTSLVSPGQQAPLWVVLAPLISFMQFWSPYMYFSFLQGGLYVPLLDSTWGPFFLQAPFWGAAHCVMS